MALDRSKRFYVFNCDKTYSVEIVETFLLEVEEKYDIKMLVDSLYFGLQRMDEVCEITLPKLVMDFAVFVVHANESRLSINEDNAGIGYARIYRALLQKTENRVLIVIGGDSYYTDEEEEARFVISRWARRKVQSQFGEEYLDGRQSFIFSWNEKHRPIHEEAMRHFLDAGKRGLKFDYTPPKPLPKATEPSAGKPSPEPIASAVAQPLPEPIASAVAQPSPEPTASAVAQPLPETGAPAVAQPLPKTRATVVLLPDSTATSDEPFWVGSEKDNLLQDDRETSGSRRHDRESQKTDLRRNLQKDTYEAVGSDHNRKSAGDQGETVLLKTKVFFGKISYEDEDVLENKDGWRPSVRQESDVKEDLESFPLREVTFYRTGNDPAIKYTYDPTPSACEECCLALTQCCRECRDAIVACFVWLGRHLRSLWDWCRDKCSCC